MDKTLTINQNGQIENDYGELLWHIQFVYEDDPIHAYIFSIDEPTNDRIIAVRGELGLDNDIEVDYMEIVHIEEV